MTITTETRTVDIALCCWRGGLDAGYEPDCFDDLECSFRLEHDLFDGDGWDEDGREWKGLVATDAEVEQMIAWWEHECEAANAGYDEDGYTDCDVLDPLTDVERSRGDEWVLFVESIKPDK